MLVLQDIAVTYHNIVPAVQGVSIEVPDKKVVALLGANGAGKTTIMRAISGLLNIHSASLVQGNILFDGERIDRLNATQIVQRGIAQVLEGRRLFADLTIEENLRTGAIASRNSAATRRKTSSVSCTSFPCFATDSRVTPGIFRAGNNRCWRLAAR